jgi:hypothetical protein
MSLAMLAAAILCEEKNVDYLTWSKDKVAHIAGMILEMV